MSSSNIAPVKWAQRKDSLYITISLADVKDHTIDLSEKKITFSGVSGNQAYTLDLELVSTMVCVYELFPLNLRNFWWFHTHVHLLLQNTLLTSQILHISVAILSSSRRLRRKVRYGMSSLLPSR